MAAYPCEGGCGFLTEQPLVELTERGHLRKRSYCSVCLERVDAFLSEQDALQEDLSRQWVSRRAQLVAAHGFERGKLPDVG